MLIQNVVVLRLSRFVVNVLSVLVFELDVVIEINILLALNIVPYVVVVNARVVIVTLIARLPWPIHSISTAHITIWAIVSRSLFSTSGR